MYGNNNLFININKSQSQNEPSSQHRIQIQGDTELSRMLIDLLGKPPSKKTEGMNPVSLKKYEDIFARVSQMSADEKERLYPQLTPSVHVLYDMPSIKNAFENDDYLKKKFEEQVDDARWLIKNGASNSCIRETCPRIDDKIIKTLRIELGCPVKAGRNPSLDDEIKMDVAETWKKIKNQELRPGKRLRLLQEEFPAYDMGMLYPATIGK